MSNTLNLQTISEYEDSVSMSLNFFDQSTCQDLDINKTNFRPSDVIKSYNIPKIRSVNFLQGIYQALAYVKK